MLLDYGSDSLKNVLKAIEAYVYLDPVRVLQQYAVPIVEKLTNLISNLKPEAMTAILACVDTMLQGSAAGDCILPVLQCMTPLVSKIVQILLEDKEMAYISARYANLLAHVDILDIAVSWRG